MRLEQVKLENVNDINIIKMVGVIDFLAEEINRTNDMIKSLIEDINSLCNHNEWELVKVYEHVIEDTKTNLRNLEIQYNSRVKVLKDFDGYIYKDRNLYEEYEEVGVENA